MKISLAAGTCLPFSASPDSGSPYWYAPTNSLKAKNGPLDCVQKNYHIAETTSGRTGDGGEDYANRLRKILKAGVGARQEGD